jgi:hypothetical protein
MNEQRFCEFICTKSGLFDILSADVEPLLFSAFLCIYATQIMIATHPSGKFIASALANHVSLVFVIAISALEPFTDDLIIQMYKGLLIQGRFAEHNFCLKCFVLFYFIFVLTALLNDVQTARVRTGLETHARHSPS